MDNEKMREAFATLCKECGPTISFYDFEMGWQAAQCVPVVGEVVDYDDDIKKRMRFYAVNDLISLSRIQSEHIARLQKKLPTMRDEQPRNPRSGGE